MQISKKQFYCGTTEDFMSTQRKRKGKNDYFLGKSIPTLFCTPSQTRALLSEGRRLVLFVRHGTTDWNLQARLQGRVEVPLNRLGKKQAESCADGIHRALDGHAEVSAVFSSPLSRAYNTAEYISRRVGIEAPVIEEKLIEREYGAVTGMTYAARRELFRIGKGHPDDMEGVTDTAQRMKYAVKNMLRRSEGDGVIIAVTHGGILNSFYSHITCKRAGCCGNIFANCAIGLVCAGQRDVIPVAFNLGTQDLHAFMEELSS